MHFRDSCLGGSRNAVTSYVLAVKQELGQSCSSLNFGDRCPDISSDSFGICQLIVGNNGKPPLSPRPKFESPQGEAGSEKAPLSETPPNFGRHV